MLAVVWPMIWPNLRTKSPFFIGRIAILWPILTGSIRRNSVSAIFSSAPASRLRAATQILSSGER